MVGTNNKTTAPKSKPDTAPEDLQTDLLMREVEEEVRREQVEKLFKQYGTYLAAAALLVLAAVGGFQVWKGRQQAAAEAAGARYMDTVRQLADKPDDAVKTLTTIVDDGPVGYAQLARLRLAAAHQKAGRAAEALTAYEALAKSSGDPLLTQFARLQAAALRLDGADWTEMQNRLNDLTGEKSPWRHSARELLALAAFKAGRDDDARKMFQELLADRRVPPSISQRAQIVMGQIVARELQAAAPVAPVPTKN